MFEATDAGYTYKRKLINAAASPAVTTAEAKTWLYVTGSDHDTLIANLVKAATQKIEADFDCAIINETFDIYADEFPTDDATYNPDGAIVLPVYPVSSITSVIYTDTTGATVTWDTANYTLENFTGQPARVLPAYNVSYPGTRETPNAVKVRIVAGFGSASTDVPEPVRLAIQLLVKLWYDNPDDMALKGNPWERTAWQLMRNFFTWRLI